MHREDFHLDGPKLVPNETEHEWKVLITKPERWWTRTQRIRTVAGVPIEMALLDVASTPVYQRIAREVLHLRQLGLSLSAVSRRLGVTDKTAARAIAWLRRSLPAQTSAPKSVPTEG